MIVIDDAFKKFNKQLRQKNNNLSLTGKIRLKRFYKRFDHWKNTNFTSIDLNVNVKNYI